MKIRFQADADLSETIVAGVLRREPAIEFLTAETGGLRGLQDPEILTLVAAGGRVLVSHDVGTMPSHFRDFTNAGRKSAGVFLISQTLEVARAIDELLLIWAATDAEEWENRLAWLPL